MPTASHQGIPEALFFFFFFLLQSFPTPLPIFESLPNASGGGWLSCPSKLQVNSLCLFSFGCASGPWRKSHRDQPCWLQWESSLVWRCADSCTSALWHFRNSRCLSLIKRIYEKLLVDILLELNIHPISAFFCPINLVTCQERTGVAPLNQESSCWCFLNVHKTST